jgi:hypothetical protein
MRNCLASRSGTGESTFLVVTSVSVKTFTCFMLTKVLVFRQEYCGVLERMSGGGGGRGKVQG